MEDFEAYGQFRERPAHAGARAAAGPAHPAHPIQPPPGAVPRPAAASRRRARSHWLRNAVLLIIAYFGIAAATTVQPLPVPFTDVRVAAPFPGGAPLLFGLPDRPFTVLVIGLDRRPGETGASRTDTVLLLRIDPNKHRAAFLSIPRDALMQIPNGDGTFDEDRINTAFVYNYDSADSSAAPRAVMKTIEHNLAIKVDHYVIFDQFNAENLVDAMGGVTIDNPREFGQDNYSNDDVNVVPQYFPEGKLELDGYEAVAYGRIREGSNDFDRIERQQRVAAALMDSAASPRSLFRARSMWSAFTDTVQTDMSMRQSAGVLSLLKRVSEDELRTKSLGDASVSCAGCSASIQLLDPVKVAEIITEAFRSAAEGQRAADALTAAGVVP